MSDLLVWQIDYLRSDLAHQVIAAYNFDPKDQQEVGSIPLEEFLLPLDRWREKC